MIAFCFLAIVLTSNALDPKPDPSDRSTFGKWLISGCEGCVYTPLEAEYEGYDGFYNNLAQPELGAIDRPLLRRWPAAYEDGTYAPSGKNRPNPLELSEKLLKGTLGTKSKTAKNALIVFFGQQVVEEILDAQRPACPPEYFNIEIPQNHDYRHLQPYHTVLPFLRTRYDQRTGFSPNNPRQQLNEITPFIDGGLFYGITKQWADQLRKNSSGQMVEKGKLASSFGGLFPALNTERLPMANPPPPFYHAQFIRNHETAKVSRHFKLGNPRGNENTFLLTFGIMWFRWHNYLAETIFQLHPEWTSDKIFNEARKWVIATQQNVIFYEWLPEWTLEQAKLYEGYDPSVNPQIDQFFQAAAFRFGHTLVVPGVYIRDYIRDGCATKFETWSSAKTKPESPSTVRTCNSFWRPAEPIVANKDGNSKEPIDIDRILMGMSVQLCEEEDHKIIEDLRGNVFGPLEFPRRDLMALNIQRARDHGLPDFNSARKAYGLEAVGFEHFNHLDGEILERFKNLYNGSIDDVDIWIGGILETNKDHRPGELFRRVIIDQFERIRNGDRFWFENKANNLFNDDEIQRIKNISIYDIILAVTNMTSDDIPRFPFNVAQINSDDNLIKACKLENSTCEKQTNAAFTCYHLKQLDEETLDEPCVKGDSYDYFSKSEISFILTFLSIGLFILLNIAFVYLLVKLKTRQNQQIQSDRISQTRSTLKGSEKDFVVVQEWISKSTQPRTVFVQFDASQKHLLIKHQSSKKILRCLDISKATSDGLNIYTVQDKYVVIKGYKINNYDLVIILQDKTEFDSFLNKFKLFLGGTKYDIINRRDLKNVLKHVVTVEMRKKLVAKFYRVVFAQAFKIQNKNHKELLEVDSHMEEVIDTELSIFEFAEQLNMRPTDEFVVRMFNLIDKDDNKFISFREFFDLLIIFANGSEEDKARLLFDMYDVNKLGELTEATFETMFKNFLETVKGQVEDDKIKTTIKILIDKAGLRHKSKFNFDDFKKILGDDIQYLKKARLDFKDNNAKPNSYLDKARTTIENLYESPAEIQQRFQGATQNPVSTEQNHIDQEQSEYQQKIESKKEKLQIVKYIEVNSKEIFWTVLYTLVLIAIFVERAYYYSVEREHSGLRRIAGYGVTVTRGAASAMMFTYSTLLLTMCRNLITYLRDTFLNNYIPFDAAVQFHKYIAYWAFVFTLMHCIGHAFNFYHISTQTADDLTCLFRNFFHATHQLPKFHYWCWQTITGFTGVLLTLIWSIMYVFANNYVRSKLYNWFWYTHNLYPIFFILMVLHGTGRLIQAPFFYYFFLGPAIVFTVDKIISIQQKRIKIPVLNAEILPSGVTKLEIHKPDNFTFKSGQWVRIACLALNENESHPFTISSAPHEKNLTLHIRAVGPWTKLIREVYSTALNSLSTSLPKIYLNGPYGEKHQDWFSYKISVLIGGGIGVTPFASILKDLMHRTHQIKCHKVYFIWVSKNQNQFEWMVDIIRELESNDVYNKVSCHIFISQIFEKFDLRTQFLYICERHYQKKSNRSLFTNLKAVTHFGRPSFSKFFKTIKDLHDDKCGNVGVFSCGPPTMTEAVNSACNGMNKYQDCKFEHHFKNF